MVRHTVLAGRYELTSPLGRGGMGQVWEGEDQRLGRRVAIKLLTDEVLAGRTDPQELARRFAREAAVTAGLQHPGVPAVYDAGSYDGGLFLAMELVSGVTLGDLVAEQGPLPVAWAAGIAAQVAAVLVAAHARRLVHRDVKPQNVMLTADGTVKVLDFGVAAVLDQVGVPRLTRTGDTIGTPAYMAPEQLQSRPATPGTDLYALGCVLYEMLAGEPVFAATSPAGLMHKHLEEAPAPLARTDLPADLAALVHRLLEKDPARRPADAQETYDRLLPHVAVPGRLGDIDPVASTHSGMHLYSRVLTRLSGANAAPRQPAPALSAEAASPWGCPRPQPTVGVSAPPGGAAPRRPWPGGGPHGGMPGSAPYGPGAAPRGGGPAGGDGAYSWRPGDGPYGPGGPAQGAGTGHYGPGSSPGVARQLVHSLWILPTLMFGLSTWLSFCYIAIRYRRPSWLAFSVAYLVGVVTAFALIGTSQSENSLQSNVGMAMGLILWPAGIVHALWVDHTVRQLRQLRRDRAVARRPAAGGAPVGSQAFW